MQRTVTLEYVILPLIMLIIVILSYNHLSYTVSASSSSSSSFSNQTVRDLIREEIINMFNDDVSASSSSSFSNQEMRDEPFDWINMSTLELTTIGNQYTDIRRVNYFSDGSNLNATLWLRDGPDRIPSDYENLVSYGMYIDADSDKETGWSGVDYQMEIAWQNEMWIRRLVQYSSLGDARVLDIQYPYTGFFEELGDYVLLSLDLDDITIADKYKVMLYAGELEQNSSISKIDFTNWALVPPPNFVMSTKPSSLVLRPGEITTIVVQVNSTTGFEPNVYLSARNADDIAFKFRLDSFHLPSYSTVSAPLQIKVSENAEAHPYILEIFANASFGAESLINTRSPVKPLSVIPNEIGGVNTTKVSTFLIDVLPPLTIEEHISEFLTTYSNFVSFIPLIITTFVTIGITRVIDIKNSPAIKSLGVIDILTIDATVIAGVLVFLTLGSEFNRLSLTGMTASIVYPFAISAIRVVTKGSVAFGLSFMIAGFVYLMASVILLAWM